MKHWKTTVVSWATAGILILTQVKNALDGNPETVFSLQVIFAALGILGLGWFASDKPE